MSDHPDVDDGLVTAVAAVIHPGPVDEYDKAYARTRARNVLRIIANARAAGIKPHGSEVKAAIVRELAPGRGATNVTSEEIRKATALADLVFAVVRDA